VFGFHGVLLVAWQNLNYSRVPVLNGVAQNASALGELHLNNEPNWCVEEKKMDF
jgi:hypothetical protein